MYKSRPGWNEYFFGIAEAVAQRADCSKARYGAVIVNGHRIVATGYNGSPPGSPKSCLAGDCPRAAKPHGSGTDDYSDCIALHAEQNAIANANWAETRGAAIYIWGNPHRPPCDMCGKLIEAAGIERIFWRAP